MKARILNAHTLSAIALIFAGCTSATNAEDNKPQAQIAATDAAQVFNITEHGAYAEPWALAFEPGTGRIFITEKAGTMAWYDPATGKRGTVTGIPKVHYHGQGGFGDIAFAPDYMQSRGIYLSWAEAGEGDEDGAVLGRGTLACEGDGPCAVNDLKVIWRQQPKVVSLGHYSHRIAFSPDGQYLFLSSGERQKGDPAQDLSNNLGKVLRLLPDGSPAPGNPFADRSDSGNEIWSYGHRNSLGLKFDLDGQLWNLEHGPAGGDEINRIEKGANYGWPIVSNGDDYSGAPIPDHDTHPEFAAPAISWNPVIAPGSFIFYSGKLWPEWKNEALTANLGKMSISRVKLTGNKGVEEARYGFGKRLRGIAEAPDGAIWIIEDGKDGRLLRLAPR